MAKGSEETMGRDAGRWRCRWWRWGVMLLGGVSHLDLGVSPCTWRRASKETCLS